MIEKLEARKLFATVVLTVADDIAANILTAQDNTTFLLKGGDYKVTSISVDNKNITIKPFDIRDRVSITGTGDFTFYQEPTGDNLSISDIDISGGKYYTIKTETTRKYSNTNGSYDGATNLSLFNCRIHDSGTHVLKLSPDCDNILINGCEIYNSGKSDPNQGQGVDAVNTDNLTVTNCYFHDCTQNNIFVKGGSQNCTINNNKMVGGWSGILLGQDTDAGAFDTVQNPNRYESLNCVAKYNIIVNPKYSGIGTYSSLNPYFEYNVVYGASKTGQAGVFISMNAFKKHGTGAIFKDNRIEAKTFFDNVDNGYVGQITFINHQTFALGTQPKFTDFNFDHRNNIDDLILMDTYFSNKNILADTNFDSKINIDDYL